MTNLNKPTTHNRAKVARQPHKLKDAGSSPVCASNTMEW